MALPFLEAMVPKRVLAAGTAAATGTPPKRFFTSAVNFGMNPAAFHPTIAGTDYDMPEVLRVLENQRKEFTVFSHLDHGHTGGHKAQHTFLSGVKLEHAAGYRDGNISLDQRLAEHCAGQTRFASMTLGGSGRTGTGWTRAGVAVPPIKSPQEAFQKLFVEDDPAAVARSKELRARGKSILDAVSDAGKAMERKLNQGDRERLDEYFTSVRETEVELQQLEKWANEPKPTAPVGFPKSQPGQAAAAVKLWYDVSLLALTTDSTRVITLAPSFDENTVEGINHGHHRLSHHGQDEEILAELRILERFSLSNFGYFMDRLKETKQADGSSLLDSTITLFGSGMGCGSRHTNENLPLIIAGGGLQHGSHIDVEHKEPLNNLYLQLLQSYGVETDYFNGSNQTLTAYGQA
jgi:hypothetical protein